MFKHSVLLFCRQTDEDEALTYIEAIATSITATEVQIVLLPIEADPVPTATASGTSASADASSSSASSASFVIKATFRSGFCCNTVNRIAKSSAEFHITLCTFPDDVDLRRIGGGESVLRTCMNFDDYVFFAHLNADVVLDGQQYVSMLSAAAASDPFPVTISSFLERVVAPLIAAVRRIPAKRVGAALSVAVIAAPFVQHAVKTMVFSRVASLLKSPHFPGSFTNEEHFILSSRSLLLRPLEVIVRHFDPSAELVSISGNTGNMVSPPPQLMPIRSLSPVSELIDVTSSSQSGVNGGDGGGGAVSHNYVNDREDIFSISNPFADQPPFNVNYTADSTATPHGPAPAYSSTPPSHVWVPGGDEQGSQQQQQQQQHDLYADLDEEEENASAAQRRVDFSSMTDSRIAMESLPQLESASHTSYLGIEGGRGGGGGGGGFFSSRRSTTFTRVQGTGPTGAIQFAAGSGGGGGGGGASTRRNRVDFHPHYPGAVDLNLRNLSVRGAEMAVTLARIEQSLSPMAQAIASLAQSVSLLQTSVTTRLETVNKRMGRMEALLEQIHQHSTNSTDTTTTTGNISSSSSSSGGGPGIPSPPPFLSLALRTATAKQSAAANPNITNTNL